MQVPLHVVLLLIFTLRGQFADEIWEQDLSMDMQIGASTKGYDLVALRCGAEKMVVDLQTSENFSGVIYTRGSFYSREPSCFLNPDHGGNFTMNIPFNQCGTENVDNKYRNTLVLQHDDELITPGDAAFILECDFSKPRDLIVSAGLPGTHKCIKIFRRNEVVYYVFICREVRSSISLVDADPGRDKTKRSGYVESDTNEVVFVPF